MTRLVTLTFTQEEAEAVWAWFHQYYPDNQDAWGSAIDKLDEAMQLAGVPTVSTDDDDGG